MQTIADILCASQWKWIACNFNFGHQFEIDKTREIQTLPHLGIIIDVVLLLHNFTKMRFYHLIFSRIHLNQFKVQPLDISIYGIDREKRREYNGKNITKYVADEKKPFCQSHKRNN